MKGSISRTIVLSVIFAISTCAFAQVAKVDKEVNGNGLLSDAEIKLKMAGVKRHRE
jgi:hypothetical protein